jgi:hypothetical protein
MTTEATTVEPASSGLLDSVQVTDESTQAAANPQAVEIDHKAAATDSTTVPGAPKDRPENIPENFWDKDKGEVNVDAMAKSYADLRKVVSRGDHKAPADGKYDLKTFGDNAENNPIAGTLSNWAKDNGLSQAQFDDLADKLQTQAKEIMGAEQIDPQAELKQLGPNANAIVDGMVNWARGLVNKGVWSKDDFEEFKIMGGTARGISALMKIREAYEGRVPTNSVPLEGALSREELQQMVADPKYKTDAGYRQKVERLFQANIK